MNKKTGYLGVGPGRAVRSDRIIGIFDLDKTTVKKDTREFLKISEQRGEVESVGFELPLSFIVTAEQKNGRRVILSPVSVGTLTARAKRG